MLLRNFVRNTIVFLSFVDKVVIFEKENIKTFCHLKNVKKSYKSKQCFVPILLIFDSKATSFFVLFSWQLFQCLGYLYIKFYISN